MSKTPVYLDANPLADKHLTGIGRYTARIALALAKVADVRFFSQHQELVLPEGIGWAADQDLGRWGRQVWQSPRRPLENVSSDSIGIYGCLRPEEKRFPFEISILHDFTPLVMPGHHTAGARGMFEGFFAKTLLSSDFALSVSHNTKADAAWLCDFPQERISVCHSGPSLCVEKHLKRGKVRRKPNLGLAVSTLEPRKNAPFLLDWFARSEALPDDVELCWAGKIGWMMSRRELKAIQKASRRKIHLLGPVSDKALCALYRRAGWTVYPSLYEGFGFPVLDALRHGSPVLTSGNSALTEFSGLEGVHFFDPCDAGTLDAAWQAMRAQGSQPAGIEVLDDRYSWDRVARTLIEVAGIKAVETASAAEAA